MKKNLKAKNLKVRPRVEYEFLHKNGGAENPVDSWRIFKIMSEFVMGFEMIRKYDMSATFFGSARYTLEDDMYKEAANLARVLSDDDFTIITGGGPGIMEAANRGACESSKGTSVGLNIELPHSQGVNKFVKESMNFHYFFTRKVMLSFASEVYIYFPGGFGTMDEFFELTTLIQTEKINRVPIILYGREYWEPLLSWFENQLAEKYHTISGKDLKIFHVVDSVEEAHVVITNLVKEYCKGDFCKVKK